MNERAIEIRDRLNEMIEEAMEEPDQEGHIIACCIALAVEELEKWMYQGDFTPSVAPYTDDREFEIPFKPGEEGDDYSGPPWARKRESVFEKFPSLKRLKKEQINAAYVGDGNTDLGIYRPNNWSVIENRCFRCGERGRFVRQITLATGASTRDARDYADRMIAEHPSLWNIDNHDGDSCPKCGSENVMSSRVSRPYRCDDCGTMWGHEWDIR